MGLLICLLLLNGWAGASDFATPGNYSIEVEYGNYSDSIRQRTIPFKLYRPGKLAGRHPVIIFSHGLGGSREAAAYLGEHLASHGYFALHIQHPGSDASLLKNKPDTSSKMDILRRSLGNARNALSRFRDIPSIIDMLEKWDLSGPLAGHLDLSAIGMSGHSYGARSTLIAAGEKIGRRFLSFRDNRITAAIAYSPGPPKQKADAERVYGDINIPLMHITGTNDGFPFRPGGAFKPADRTQPFQQIPHTPQYLIVLDGADHMVFSGGTANSAQRPRDAAFLDVTKAASLVFWNAMLRQDTEARDYLNDDAFSNNPLVARYDIKG